MILTLIMILSILSGFNMALKKSQIGMKKVTLADAEKVTKAKPLKEVTTKEFWTKLGIQVFEYKKDKNTMGVTYFIKNNRLLDLPRGYTNINIKDTCIADLNKDGKAELLYTYTFGSGLLITVFCCYVDGEIITANFGSIKFCSFKFMKKNMQQVKLGVWWPDLEQTDKNSIPIGSLYIKGKVLGIKLYDNISAELKECIMQNPVQIPSKK